MFRQTAPGSIDAITNQAGWTVTSPNSMYSYKSADCFIVGPQLAVQEQMQDQLLQQLRQHSLRDKLHTDASSSSAPPVSGRLCTDQFPLPAPVTVSKAASTANNSFSFQTGMPGQTQEALEALFEKAEAVVQDFIDSPQAAMLFGEDSTLESLTELCARLPSATRPPDLLSSPADTAGQIMNPPCTPQSCRKRPQPPAQHPTFPGTAHDHSMNTLEAPRSHAGGTTGNCRISIDAAGPPPRRRWGLDLSDEGSDYSPDWCRSSGITSGAPAAMFSPQLKQPRSSDCCISHSIRASDSASLAGNLSLIQGSHAAAMQPAGTPKSSTGRKIKIKMKGAGSPMQGSGRSSCPGGYVSGGRSRMGRISSTAANMSFPVVLDLSTPPPNSPQTPADCANNSCAVAASPAGRSSPGAGALSRIAGGGGSSSMRLSGHKHSKDGRISDISQQSLRPVTAAVDRQSGPGALLSSPGALTGPEGVLHDAHEWPQAGSPAKRRSRLGASCETSSGGADLAFQSCFQAAAVPGGNADKVPAAADQHPSFTSWAIDSIATAAAAAVTMDAGEDGAVKYRSPFENAEAVKATLRAYEAAPVPHSALLPARVRGSRRSRQSTPGGKAAATAAVLLLGEPQQCGGSSNGSFGLDNGVTSDAKHQQQQPGQADLPPVAAAPTAGEAGQAGCMFDSPMQMYEGGFGGGCAGLYCHNCGSGDSPQWRTGPEGPKTLCNRCGVRFKKSTPAYAAAANPAAVQAAAQAHALSLAASAHTAAVVTRPAQQSPFAATAVQNVSLSQQGQVMIPRCAADVGISITTQSGTGPSARRVSSQPLLLPCGPVDHASKGNTHVPPQPGRLNVPQQFHNVAGGSHPPLEQQQHRVLHLQLPRIRTKSQMLHEGAFPDAFGIAAGSSSSAGCSSLADPHSSSTATPSTGARAAAVGCGDCTGLTQGSKPLSPGLLNHIAMMNLHGGNMQDSPASAMSSCSWAGTGIFGDTAAVAVAAGGTKRFCNVQHLENTGAHGVMMSSKQQRQQQVQQQCMLAADNPYSMYAPYCKGRPVTTSMPVVQPQATPAVPLAAAVAHTAAAGFAATAAPVGLQASSVQQQQAWPS